MKKKAKQKPCIMDPPKDITELGERFIILGEALQDDNTKLQDLRKLSLSCGLILKFSMLPKS